jgi:hypothetical protein
LRCGRFSGNGDDAPRNKHGWSENESNDAHG